MYPSNHNKLGKEADPQFVYMNAFQHTFASIRRNLHLASRATRGEHGRDGMTNKERHAFARHALSFTETLGPKDPRRVPANLFARMPDYVDAIRILPDRRSHDYGRKWIDQATYDQQVMKTINYNNGLREIIDNNPKLLPNLLMKIVTATANRYGYGGKEKAHIEKSTKGIIFGMQHELAFESALIYLPEGFEIIETTNRDDAEGKDFKVRCPNGKVVSIDVKATPELQEEARYRKQMKYARRNQTPPENEIILFSGFDQDDFEWDNPWRPKHEAIMHALPHIEAELRAASGEKPAQKAFAHSL